MLLSAVSVLVVAQSIFEIPEGLMNNPVFILKRLCQKKNKSHGDVSISSDIEWICSPKMNVTYVD